MTYRYIQGLLAFIFFSFSCIQVYAEEDHRAWQHGIELLKLNGNNLLIWSSSGNPPALSPGKDWKHDIYYAWIDDCAIMTAPSVLIAVHEAQEPPSVAVNKRGKVLLTWEDGSDGINQYAAFFDEDIQNKKNTFLIRAGGHSGHVAASNDKFLIAYSEDWDETEIGFLDRGTGKNLFARIIEDNGHVGPEIRVSPGTALKREDWPLVAGSSSGWLILWQRYPERTLHTAVIGYSGSIRRHTLVAKDLLVGYHYDVQYISALNSYIVLATTTAGGVALLINTHGQIIARNDNLPPLVSESRFIWTNGSTGIIGVYPVMPSGVAVIHVSNRKITLQKNLTPAYRWDYIGTTGAFVSPSDVLFATLSTDGLKIKTMNIFGRRGMSHSKLCATEDSD